MDRIIGVYKLHNPITGKFYIGSGILEARKKFHFYALSTGKHPNYKLQQAYNEDPNFEFIGTPIDKLATERDNRNFALNIEQKLIDESINNKKCLNIAIDVDVFYIGRKHTNQTIQKLREAKLRRWSDPIYREMMTKAQRNGWIKISDEKRKMLSDKRSKMLINYYSKIGHSPTKGQVRNEEFKKRNSQIVTELWKDPVFREKIIKARQGKNYIPPGIKVEINGKIYSSIGQAAKDLGMSKPGVIYRLDSDRKKFSGWKKLKHQEV